VEIATGAEFTDPETPAKVALYIGQLMRATGKVRRGIGTIRQDINISIAGGARQEIKGIQELEMIPEVIRREVQRQKALLEIRNELKKRGAAAVRENFVNVTNVFSTTGSQVIKKAVKNGGIVLAVLLPKFRGLLGKEVQPGRRFGTELADVARVYGGVGGIFHTDELPGYGIGLREVEEVKKVVGADVDDVVVLVAEKREKAELTLMKVVERVNMALDGVPEETRRALPDGNTEFMRPLPGAARMYPETDIPPVLVDPEMLRRMKKSLPELPEVTVERLKKMGLS
ncbi:MAG: Glu-tRNA(Gln) amidotransferase subunit GatE, partial [Candidatus Hadarchaeales archaeon]